MSVSREHLQHLCKLAALNLSDEQMDKFGPQIDSIVGLVSKLESLDLGDTGVAQEFVGHSNRDQSPGEFDLLTNIKHPIAGNMPSISFSTRGEG